MTVNRKVALVNPPLPVDIGHHPQFPPLGLAYMAAVLDQNGFEVKIIDCPVNGITHEQLKAELQAFQPALIGTGSMTPTIESAFKVCQVAKEVCPNATVVMGGPHATYCDKRSPHKRQIRRHNRTRRRRGNPSRTCQTTRNQNQTSRHQRHNLPQRHRNRPNSQPPLHPRLRCSTTSRLQIPKHRKILRRQTQTPPSHHQPRLPLCMQLLRRQPNVRPKIPSPKPQKRPHGT